MIDNKEYGELQETAKRELANSLAPPARSLLPRRRFWQQPKRPERNPRSISSAAAQ